MSDKPIKPARNRQTLEARITSLSNETGRPVRRIQRAVANTVVGQMIPDGVVKGGTAMKLRIGEAGSRFTPDFDASRGKLLDLDDYIAQLQENLATGWGGFTGTVAELDPPHPEGVPDDYIMKPFEIRLAFFGSHWLKVEFELGRDEVGSTERAEIRFASDLLELFAKLGLDEPAPVPLLPVDHQIAQKLHACTSINTRTGENERAHDLVDLQLIEQEEEIDLLVTATTAERLFAARRAHEWPPTVRTFSSWPTIYAEAADGLEVLGSIDEAVEWANSFIAKVVAAKE